MFLSRWAPSLSCWLLVLLVLLMLMLVVLLLQMTRLHAQHPHVIFHDAAVNSCCPGWCLSEMSATIAANNDTSFAKSAPQGAVSHPLIPRRLPPAQIISPHCQPWVLC